MNISDYDFLEPAHVFKREDGRTARLLFLTNTALSQKQQKQFPPQVVYADENNNVLSCDIERFLSRREFVNVDPELEQRLNALLVGSSTSDDDELDLDTDELLVTDADSDSESDEDGEGEDADDFETELQVADDTEDQEVDSKYPLDEDSKPIAQFIPQNELQMILDPQYLATLVSSYQETPNLIDGSIVHTVFVRAAEGVTKEKLYASFSPTHEELNNTFAFKIMLNGQLTTIDWDAFGGVYSCVYYESEMFQLIFVESSELRSSKTLAAAEAAVAAETAVEVVEAEEVEVTAPPATVVANTTGVVVQASTKVTASPAAAPAQIAVTIQPQVAAQ